MRVTGSCYCKQVSFTADVLPESTTICHCTDCQKLAGSAYRVTTFAPAESFSMEGAVKTFVKVAASGRKRLHAFCPGCGSPIYASAPENPDTYGLRVGLIDQRNELPPVRQIWCSSALEWTQNIGDLPKSPEG